MKNIVFFCLFVFFLLFQFSQYDNIFGEVNAKPTKSSTSLKSDNPEHEKFLQQYTLLKEFIKLLPTARVLPQLITIRFSTLEGNVEAKKMLDDAVVELTEAVKTVYNADDVLVLSTSSKTSRAKRAADDSAKQTKGDPIVSIEKKMHPHFHPNTNSYIIRL